ncbi:MAG: hypothetical protein ACI9FU_000513 [Granulosicoccus sp.]|jgi:hypothetical protein
MELTKLRLPLLSFALMGLMACESAEQQAPPPAPKEEEKEMDLADANQMLREMPSPIEMAILVKHSGGAYDPDLLNPIKNLDNYVASGKKAMNLGVYSADVGYTTLYKQTQETILFMNNIRKLSDAIGLSDAFDQSTFDRVEANIENRDSLLHIITGAYQVSNDYLKENNRLNTSILIISSGWLESMYLASKLDGEEGQMVQVSARIAEQSIVLEKLVNAMALIPNDPTVAEFQGKLAALLIEFNKEVLVTGDEENLVVNEARMAEIYAEIDIIRAWMIA